jgi:DNA polymerase III subunit beta
VQVSFKRDSFVEALSACAAVAPSRSSRASLMDALLVPRADMNSFELLATDLEVGIRYQVESAQLKGSGSALPVALPVMLAGLLKECTDEYVQMEVESGKHKGVLHCGRDVFDLTLRDAADFPDVAGVPGCVAPCFSCVAGALGNVLDQTMFAAARESGRYSINGIHLKGVRDEGKWSHVDVVATDGRRLALAELPVIEGVSEALCGDARSIIVPLKMAREIKRLCEQDESGTISVYLEDSTLIVHAANVVLSGVLISGIFPKYRQVMPKGLPNSARFSREELLRGLSKSSYLEDSDTHAVNLVLGTESCEITTRAADKGQSTVVVAAEIKIGKDVASGKLRFTSNYLIDALRAVDAEHVLLSFSDGTKPVVMTFPDKVSIVGFEYVLMPQSEAQ